MIGSFELFATATGNCPSAAKALLIIGLLFRCYLVGNSSVNRWLPKNLSLQVDSMPIRSANASGADVQIAASAYQQLEGRGAADEGRGKRMASAYLK